MVIMCATLPELAKECFRQTGSEGQGNTTVLEFLLRQALIPSYLLESLNSIFSHVQALIYFTLPIYE